VCLVEPNEQIRLPPIAPSVQCRLAIQYLETALGSIAIDATRMFAFITNGESSMGALPNLFDGVISSELATGKATAESISLALASSELFHKAVQMAIDEATVRQFDTDMTAKFVRVRIGTSFSASLANMMYPPITTIFPWLSA
jgi:hypothetical protein